MLFAKNLFSSMAIATLASALFLSAAASPTVQSDSNYESELLTWLATTDANITYVGPKPGSTNARVGGNVNVVYCTTRQGSVCGGACTVYNGGAKCLNAPNTNCLKASANVVFCGVTGCSGPSGSCNTYNTCGTRLDNGFCWTPATKSIAVPFI